MAMPTCDVVPESASEPEKFVVLAVLVVAWIIFIWHVRRH